MPVLRLLLIPLLLFVAESCEAQQTEKPTPTHEEIEPLKFDLGGANGKIETMAMDGKGNLLVSVSWTTGNAQQQPNRRPSRFGNEKRQYAIKIVSPEGKVVSTWPFKNVAPKMLHGTADGTVYVGAEGSLLKLNADGKVVKEIKFNTLPGEKYRSAHSSGITVNDKYVFLALGFGFSLRATEDIMRFDRDLQNPKVIVKQQFGCCSHIDLDTRGDELLIAENSRHRVNRFTFDGEPIGRWGRRDRTGIEGFAACCNPVNFDFDGDRKVLYTAESGIGRVKKYHSDGTFLGLVGYVDTTKFDRGSRLAAMSCYIPIEVSPDAKRIYIVDVRAHVIRVLVEKPTR